MRDRDDDDRPRRRDDSDDDRPAPRPGNGFAITALVLGILSFFCLAVTGLPAMLFGVLGMSKASKTGTGKGLALAGLGLGLVGTLASIPVAYLVYRGIKGGADAIASAKDNVIATNNMRQVVLAAHGYENEKRAYPPGALTATGGPKGGPKGAPAPTAKSLSWRVAVLPHLGQQGLYNEFQTNQPWDSAANIAAGRWVEQYADPEERTGNQTRYRGFVSPGAVFDPAAGPVGVGQITDGQSNTILFAQAADRVPWAQYFELRADVPSKLPAFGMPNRDTFLVAFCDGSVRAVKKSVDPKVFSAAVTRAGGEVVPLDW